MTADRAPIDLTDREIATRLAVIKVLEGKIATLKGELGDAARAGLRSGDNVAAYLDGDERMLGRMGLSKPRASWKVTDPDALAAWTAVYAPEELETRPVVRNSFIGALLAACKAHGGWASEATGGEIVVPDGVELIVGEPVLSVRLTDDAEAVVTDALAAGRIGPDGTSAALPAPESNR